MLHKFKFVVFRITLFHCRYEGSNFSAQKQKRTIFKYYILISSKIYDNYCATNRKLFKTSRIKDIV